MLDRWITRIADRLLHRAVAAGWRDRPTLQRDLSILTVVATLAWSWRSVVEEAYVHPLFLLFPFASILVAATNVRSYAMVAGLETTPHGRDTGRHTAAIWRDRPSLRLVLAAITVFLALTTIGIVFIWFLGHAPFFPFASVAAVAYFAMATVVAYLGAVDPVEPVDDLAAPSDAICP